MSIRGHAMVSPSRKIIQETFQSTLHHDNFCSESDGSQETFVSHFLANDGIKAVKH